MSQVSIELEKTAYEPGETISGYVHWNTGGERYQRVLVSLLWHTEGKGNEDVEVIHQVNIPASTTQDRRQFSFELPNFPWSFSGRLISLVWNIEASLEPRGDVHRETLVLAPGGVEVRL